PLPEPGTSSTLGVPVEDLQVGDATLNAAIIAHDVNSDDAAAGITTPPAATAGLTIVTQELPSGRVGDDYVAPSSVDPVVRLRASGGTPPYVWSLTAGALPSGLALATSTGDITGTPGTAGSFSFRAQVTDTADPPNTDQRDLVIAIAPTGIASLVVVSQPNPCTDTANPAPTCVRPGEVIVPAVSVKAIDSSGTPAAGVAVTLAIGSGPGAVLGGTTVRTTNSSGVAVFNDLTLSLAGVYSLDASAGEGFAPASTGDFNVIAPDLIVASLTHDPANPTTADTITFTATVENTGTDNAPASTLMFKIGGETTGAEETLFDVPALGPGESFAVQRQEQKTARNFINTATADYFDEFVNEAVIETDETNNTTTDDYTVIEPSASDLVVASLTHDPANPTTADTITFTATVRNDGTAPAPASTLRFTIGDETPGVQSDFAVPELGPGAEFTVTRLELLNVARGYGNTAIADFGEVVAETNEINNTTTHNYLVTNPPIG
ncbi:MAG: putative Ig domain-containing protein, partial [Planctomycetes bacterium]|nr:putative Ig domain-containing protein [Planctomycetota bacterium]